MPPHKVSEHFATANPHALSVILEASETRSIIAACDIFDIQGIKLWARHRPVSRDLQQRLMDRALSQPLETCLLAEDGVSTRTLALALRDLVQNPGPLQALLKPQASALLQGVMAIRLHPVVQLLFSAVETSQAPRFAHAIEAMAMAGALMAARGGDAKQVAQAMTVGLLHDVGEMYIDPAHGEAEIGQTADVDTYRQLLVHPHIGQLLITQLTDYPKDVARAVAEHHERMDGSGFPHQLEGPQMSTLGKLLSTVEAALAALRQPGANLQHASVVLRAVPGEFCDHLLGPLAAAARAEPALQSRRSLPELQAHLAAFDATLDDALARLEDLLRRHSSASLQEAGELARHLLTKLRGGWNESGLWCLQAIGSEQAAEAEAVQAALVDRLHAIERAARLSAGPLLPPDEDEALGEWCQRLAEKTA
jgi:HD superfamily phosphohydrolase YqeK